MASFAITVILKKMKKYIIIISFILFAINSHAQLQLNWGIKEFSDTSGQNGNAELYGYALDSFGNSFVIKYEVDKFNFNALYRIQSFDSKGVKRWEFKNDSCTTICSDVYKAMLPDGKGGLFLFSNFDVTIGAITVSKIRLQHLNTNGNLLWKQDWACPYTYGANNTYAKCDNAGDIVVAFTGQLDFNNFSDFCFAKFDSTNGNTIWHLEIPDQGPIAKPLTEIINSFDIDSNNNIYAAGIGNNVAFLIFRHYRFKINSNGTINYMAFDMYPGIITFGSGAQEILYRNTNEAYILLSEQDSRIEKRNPVTGAASWVKFIKHDSAQVATFTIQEFHNTLYAFSNYRYDVPDSTFQGHHFTPWKMMMTKFDALGATLFQKDLNPIVDTNLYSFKANQVSFCNNNMYVASFLSDVNVSQTNYAAISKLDTFGNLKWHDTIAGSPVGFGIDKSCHVYLARTNQGNNPLHINIIKYGDTIIKIPEALILKNVNNINIYPNPMFNKIIVENIKLNSTITIIDLNGKILNSILNTENKIEVNTEKYSVGQYFIAIKNGDEFVVKKIEKK
jgi:hypothetical protein